MLPTPIKNDAEKRGNFDFDRTVYLPGELRRMFLPMLPTPVRGSGRQGLHNPFDGGAGARKKARALGLMPNPRASDADKAGHGEFLTVLPGYELRHAGTLPTPTARVWRSGKASEATHAKGVRPLNETLTRMGGNQYGQTNPRFLEWMMGYPIGWTELKPLETPSSPELLR
jgi:DNA (cytosine-5)-methyltransferase 1